MLLLLREFSLLVMLINGIQGLGFRAHDFQSQKIGVRERIL